MCNRPITAFRSRKGPDKDTGKWPLVFNTKEGHYELNVQVPCGQCIDCKLLRSKQWAMRIVHEASLYKENNCFITLTYDDYMLPLEHSLDKTDIQKFLKRLRKLYTGKKIRFFQCGEYGEACRLCHLNEKKCECTQYIKGLGRAHHHILLFNHTFTDRYVWRANKKLKIKYYRSKTLEKLWPFGHSEIGQVNFDSAAYVARYVCKKQTGPPAENHYQDIDPETGLITAREPEYITMSRNHGIAHEWFQKFKHDIYPSDECPVKKGGTFTVAKPPKYYDNLYDLENPEELIKIKKRREKKAKKLNKDNTPERLLVKETIKLKQYSKLIRPLERQ